MRSWRRLAPLCRRLGMLLLGSEAKRKSRVRRYLDPHRDDPGMKHHEKRAVVKERTKF